MGARQAATKAIIASATAVLRTADRYITGSSTGASPEELQQNPYAAFAKMRERGRVLRSYMNRGWYVLGFEEAQTAFREPRLSSDLSTNPFLVRTLRAIANGARVPTLDDPTLITMDPPDHTRLRKLAARGFIQRHIQALEPKIQHLVDECLGRIDGESVDIVEALAKPLPAIVIAEMLGLPAQDRDQFQAWSNELLNLTQLGNPAAMERAVDANVQLLEYLATVVEEKRRSPGQDLISQFILAEEEGDKLSAAEIYSTCSLLLIAGHETTTRLISNGLHALLTHPDQFDKLREDPSLIPNAIEEMLRYDPPVQWMPRTITEDFEFFGKQFRKNQLVIVAIAAANRDPAIYDDPDTFDVARSEPKHVAFGHGIHLCLGMTLARLEAKVAFETLLARYPQMSLVDQKPAWQVNNFVRGLESLPIHLNGGAPAQLQVVPSQTEPTGALG